MWIFKEFEAISSQCGGCLEVSYQRSFIEKSSSSRANEDVWVVNVLAVQRGSLYPNRYVLMSGDIDSSNSDGSDGVGDATGANDNA